METQIHTKHCNFCHAEAGKPRPVGRYVVKLQMVDLAGEKKKACQSCAHKHHKILRVIKAGEQEESHVIHAGLLNLKKIALSLLHLGFMFLVFSEVLLAQPPGLPASPSQAPIDGGLGILAAAGGAYALKKLRDKRAE